MAAGKPYPKQPEGLRLGGTGLPPQFGTFTPPADYHLSDREAAIEWRVRVEQDKVADLIRDAVAIWGTTGRRVIGADAAAEDIRRRAGELSPSARLTARTLTKVWLDSKRPPDKLPAR